MKKLFAVAAVLVVSLLVARVASAEQRFTDPGGDSGGAPDITVVNVANDAAGNLTFTVTTNQPALAGDVGLALFFNVDKNNSTGDVDGDEFGLFLEAAGWEFDRWDGTRYVQAAAPTANASYSNGVLTFRVNKADLANTNAFSFYAVSIQVNTSTNQVVARDDAPDGSAIYEYTLTAPPPLTLRASAPVAVPARPAAGKAFAVRIGVTRGDTGAALASGTATCRVTLGGKALRALGSVRAGRAACSMLLPRTARGKTVRGTIRVTFRNVSVTRSFAYRVP